MSPRTAKMAETSLKNNALAILYRQGEVSVDEIDDFVDAWHEGGTGLPSEELVKIVRRLM